MTLKIEAGMFAVLRNGDVPEGPIEPLLNAYQYVWRCGGLNYTRLGRYWGDRPQIDPRDIVATFATRAEALAYVADNPMNRELYPDGPDLAPAPVTVPADDLPGLFSRIQKVVDAAKAERDRWGTIAATIRVNALHHGASTEDAEAMVRGEKDFIAFIMDKVDVPARLADFRKTFCEASPGSDEGFPSFLEGFDQAIKIMSEAKTAPAPQTVAHLVPEHSTGTALAFEPGVLHINKDGSGYIAIDEKHFECEDDRGPDGGSVHWITRLDASEMVALRDFLTNGTLLAPAPVVVDWQARAEAGQVLADLVNRLFKAPYELPREGRAEIVSALAVFAAAKEPRL
jgi:hypothetical protein